MSKAVLVMDMPEKCSRCKFAYEFWGVKKCNLLNILRNGDKAILEQEKFAKERGENCPLVPMPEKQELSYPDEFQAGYVEGYNTAIDAIGGNEQHDGE